MTMSDLPPVEMDEEYEAWQQVVAEWRKHPSLAELNMNDPSFNPLIRAIELWGERLTALRLQQTSDERAQALDGHLVAYEQARGS